ncbi:MAG: hypothetical protein COA97_00950 [Flavobacteriales bacterium]|nr:MAG: hypothetical protein COA97_00950 [Flavobacteriales bacterium]
MQKIYSLKGRLINVFLLCLFTLQTINVSSQICPCATSVSGWAFQKAFLIDNSTNPSALTNYQVLIDLNTTTLIGAGDMNADGSDIRVSGLCDNSDPLNFWFDDINTANTKIWVNVPNVAANGTETIYIHYGNSAATTATNGVNTFEAFDDFEAPLAGWTFSGGTWTNSTFLGENVLECTNLATGSGLAALLNSSLGINDYIVEMKYASGVDGAMGGPFFEHNDFSNYNGYHLMTGSDVTMIATITGGSANYGQSQAFVSVPNQWYDWKVVRNGTANTIDIYLDNLLQNSNATVFTDGVGAWAYGSSNSVYYDNLFVRKYTAIEPTTSELTIADAIAPVADLGSLPDATGQCAVTPTAPTATDNCAGSVTGTTTATLPITAQGTTTITWTYVDGNGNTSTQTQDVVITDITAPVTDVTTLTDATGQCSVASVTAPTATDNCVGSVTGTTTATFPITAQGTTTITWTYVDGNGNSSTQTQDVVITDATAPVADVTTLVDATGQCSVASVTAPTATDNCVGSVTGTTTATFPITAQGTTTITWTYIDGNGNSSTQTQDVVITDITAPVADVTTLLDSVSECEVTPMAPTATDNCVGVVTGTTSTTFPITASGTTTITWTYMDGNGNTSTQTQDVVITPIDTTVTLSGDTMTANASGYSYQWVDCDNGNAPVAGATSQSFVPSTGGNYAVEINNGTCTITSPCNNSTVSINENTSLSNISIFPNPANDVINVNLRNITTEVNITMMSVDGKVIYQLNNITDKNVSIDISNNSKGIYFLRIGSNNEFKVYKVIKQ